MLNDEYYMNIAIQEAKKSEKSGDIPIGAVIVCDNKIIAKSHNTKEKKQSVIGHAEINVITKANKKIGSYRLDGATLYVTKEPCLMCMGTILSARIAKVVFGAKDLRFGTMDLATDNNFNHKCDIVGGVLETECSNLLTDFFKKLRGNNESKRKTNSITKENR